MPIYDSERLAYGYAFLRPRVHEEVLRLVESDLGLAPPLRRALDVGCGAGRSTAPLRNLARRVVGIEPFARMLEHRRDVAPGCMFVVGRAESLPFAEAVFDLVTAAGSLSYVDRFRFAREAIRVLTPGGILVVYDFSSGRRNREDGGLDAWFAGFERRFPFPPGYAFDVQELHLPSEGLALVDRRTFVVERPFTLEAYLSYVLTETNVEQALAAGALEGDVRAWCRTGLEPLFAGSARVVQFEGYVAYLRRS